MKDPPRLLDEGADAFERSLLTSASRDIGSERLLKRTLSAAGVAAVSVAATTIAGAAPPAGAATTIAGAAPPAGAAAPAGAGIVGAVAKAETIALVKWILGGALAGLSTIGVYEYAQPPAETKAVVAGPAVNTAAASGRTFAAGHGARADDAAALGTETSEKPQAPSIASSRSSAAAAQPAVATPEIHVLETNAEPPPIGSSIETTGASTSPTAPSRGSSLTAEVTSLDRARQALGARDAGRALRELDRHRAEFPAGLLGPETTVLRIEALVLSGRRAEAQALAEQLLRSPANAAYATRIESLLRRTPNP